MKDYSFSIDCAGHTLTYIQIGRKDVVYMTSGEVTTYLHKVTGANAESISSGFAIDKPAIYLGVATTAQANNGQYSADRNTGHYVVFKTQPQAENT